MDKENIIEVGNNEEEAGDKNDPESQEGTTISQPQEHMVGQQQEYFLWNETVGMAPDL